MDTHSANTPAADPLRSISLEGFDPDHCATDFGFYNDFSLTPVDNASMYFDAQREEWAYHCKHNVSTQQPWVEWGHVFYDSGFTLRGTILFGSTNLVRPEFYAYGDSRSGILTGRNAMGRSDNWAKRLNLDLDLKLNESGRFHSFISPIDKGADFTRLQLVDSELQSRQELDLTPVTGFFEGDFGSMLGGLMDTSPPSDLPIPLGLIPLLLRNGIWMEDAVTGGTISYPTRQSNLLNWSNYGATFFAIFDQLNSPAFGTGKHAAQAFGTVCFIAVYGGDIESFYACVRDRNISERSYHNATTSFTRCYFDRISNSRLFIVNAGQDLPEAQHTDGGVLLLVENSWITASPLTVIPYANFFVGLDRPQSVARAGIETAWGVIGIDLIGNDLDHQLVLEVAYLPHMAARMRPYRITNLPSARNSKCRQQMQRCGGLPRCTDGGMASKMFAEPGWSIVGSFEPQIIRPQAFEFTPQWDAPIPCHPPRRDPPPFFCPDSHLRTDSQKQTMRPSIMKYTSNAPRRFSPDVTP